MILDEIIALNVQRQLEAFRLEDQLRMEERLETEVDRQVKEFCEEHDRQCKATCARMEKLEAVFEAAKAYCDTDQGTEEESVALDDLVEALAVLEP